MQPSGMSITQLRAFVAVADAGRFTSAAELIGLTQPAVSSAIRSLERILGVTLFGRGRTRAEITEVGRTLLGHAREAMAQLESLQQVADAAQGLESGRVRLGSVPSAAARLVPRLLRKFRNDHPKVEIVVIEGTDQEVREWIDTGVVDAGIGALPLEGMTTVVVAEDEYLLVVPSTHPFALKPRASLREIRDDPLILSAGGCGPQIRELLARAAATPRIDHEVRATSALLSMVREGLGLTILPTLSLPPGARGLIALPLSPRAHRTLALAWRPTHGPSPALAAFASMAALSARPDAPSPVRRDGAKRSRRKSQAS